MTWYNFMWKINNKNCCLHINGWTPFKIYVIFSFCVFVWLVELNLCTNEQRVYFDLYYWRGLKIICFKAGFSLSLYIWLKCLGKSVIIYLVNYLNFVCYEWELDFYLVSLLYLPFLYPVFIFYFKNPSKWILINSKNSVT